MKYHNHLMSLCNLTFVALSKKIADVAAKGPRRKAPVAPPISDGGEQDEPPASGRLRKKPREAAGSAPEAPEMVEPDRLGHDRC